MTFSYGLLLLLSHCDIVKQICDQFHERVPRTAESDRAKRSLVSVCAGLFVLSAAAQMGQIELQGGKGRAQQETLLLRISIRDRCCGPDSTHGEADLGLGTLTSMTRTSVR